MAAAIIMAAGRGQRLGQGPKAFAQLQGESFLAHGVRLLREGGITEVVAVVPEGTSSRVTEVVAVENLRRAWGPLWSILLGLGALPEQEHAVFVHHVDHPLVRAQTIKALISATAGLAATVARVVPTYDGRRGHPIVVTRPGVAALRAVTDPGATTLRDVLASAGEVLEVPVDDPYVLRNINTPEELARCSSMS